MTTQSITPATEGQKKQIRATLLEIGDEAIKALCLNKEQAQRLIDTSRRDIESALVACLRGFVVTDEFVDEEVESSYGYLSGYEKADAHGTQFAAIKHHFPQAESYDTVLAAKDAPAESEGNFLILPWQRIASTYGEAVEIVFAKLREARGGKFHNYREGELGPDRLQEEPKKVDAMKALAETQAGHDVLVVSAQLGLRHRGRSVRRACAVMNGNEFGLGAYEMGFVLLTHSNRLEQFDDLWVNCAGDRYRYNFSGEFISAPYFNFDDDELKFATDVGSDPYEYEGAASAFVPVPSPE